MNNGVKNVVKDVAKEITKEVYTDTIKPTAQNVGNFFGTLSGFFDKVVLYPLKKLNITYEQKAIAFQKEMEEKYNNIPIEHRCEPKLSIVGPAMESLKYNMLEDEMRELFKNLLINSMDDRIQGYGVPAYIKIIEQMNSVDAEVLKRLHGFRWKSIVYITLKVEFTCSSGRKQTFASKKYFTEEMNLKYKTEEISASLANLERLGLISLSSQYLLAEKSYKHIMDSERVKEEIKLLKGNCLDTKDLEIKVNECGLIEFSDFANGFAKICELKDI